MSVKNVNFNATWLEKSVVKRSDDKLIKYRYYVPKKLTGKSDVSKTGSNASTDPTSTVTSGGVRTGVYHQLVQLKKHANSPVTRYEWKLPPMASSAAARNSSAACDRMCNGKRRVRRVCTMMMRSFFNSSNSTTPSHSQVVDDAYCAGSGGEEEVPCNTHCTLRLLSVHEGCEMPPGHAGHGRASACGEGRERQVLKCFRRESFTTLTSSQFPADLPAMQRGFQVDLSACDPEELARALNESSARHKICHIPCNVTAKSRTVPLSIALVARHKWHINETQVSGISKKCFC